MIKSFAYSIVVMVLLLLIEFIFSRRMKKRVFDFSDTLTNIACGIMERTFFLLFAVLYYSSFNLVYDEFALFSIEVNWLSILLLFFIVDFLWYWYHRAGHEINILWAAHITHHQSEEYNLSLSFRVSFFQLIIRMFFWLWIPILGFDPTLTILIIGINAAYQFFIHTRLIKKLGFLEHILVTPSHHRVHHGKNEQYIDKNYGGVLIFWDKLFGTFAEEKEEVMYGITKPLHSRNPVHAWFHYYADLFDAAKYCKGWRNKIALFFSGPESMTEYYHSIKKDKSIMPKEEGELKVYLTVQFGILVILFFVIYYCHEVLPYLSAISISLFMIYSALTLGFVLDRHKISFALEVSRVLFMSVVAVLVLKEFQYLSYSYIAVLPLFVFLPWIFNKKSSF